MSLVFAVNAIYGKERSFRAGDGVTYRQLQQMGPEQLDEYSFVSGHFSSSFFRKRTRATWKYISILRDPVDRLISVYNYISTETWHPLHESLGTLDPDAFFTEVMTSGKMRNEQCSFFCDDRSASGAIRELSSFDWTVASIDALDRFVDRLAIALGRNIKINWENKSKGTLRRHEIPPQLIDRIYAANCEDLKLFRWLTQQPNRLWENAADGPGEDEPGSI
jgi:hypothetical protein